MTNTSTSPQLEGGISPSFKTYDSTLISTSRKSTFPISNPITTSNKNSPNLLNNPQLSHILVPESPLIDLTMSSPDHRNLIETASITSSTCGVIGEEKSKNSIKRSGSYKRQIEPRFLNDPSPSNILSLLETQESSNNDDNGDLGRELRIGLILRRSIKWAIERSDTELIGWLVGLEGKWADILDFQANQLEDEEGWGIVGMAIQASCHRQETEECVRIIVGRWGLEVGQRGGRDRTGWTPLHLAALISTPPLISFLLSRGSSPHALTNRGLTPLDLVVGMPDREDVALFLEHATCHGESSTTPKTATTIIPHFPPARQAMLERRRRHATLKKEAIEREETKQQLELERETWLRERARMVDVDPELLIKPLPTKRDSKTPSDDSGLGWMGYELDLEAERTDDEDSEYGEDDDFDVNQLDLNSNMLVFSLSHLPTIFDILITEYIPVCQPLRQRTLPANALYLYARFAQYKCDETWLEELIEGIVDRIEQGVYSNVENLAYLAFWAYNSAVLLHLLKSDPPIHAACEHLGLLSMMEELINAIHVFVIRVAERRIDMYLDAAILDYETLEDFNDIRFEGEWSLFRSFAPKKKRETPRAASIFAPSPAQSSGQDSPHSPSVYGTPHRTPNRHQSMSDLRLGTGTPRSISHDSSISGHSGFSHMTPTVELEINPSRITDILSGVLLILQLYEVNPAIVVQAFSQIFFWISCELFNRILAQKKYLCRTKALQIKMNITVLDDWVRANGLPAQTATKHLEPVTQLLQWLQCLSQIKEFDTLIGTMQNMRAINPLQMRRAVRDYKYEVNEGKMNEECAQYLAQLQKDWEKRRVQFSVQEAERRKSLSSLSSDQNHEQLPPPTSDMQIIADDSTPIDALFDGTIALGEFVPSSSPECLGELLDSRYMLPFILPYDNAYLVAAPPKDAAYRNLFMNPASPFISDGSKTNSRPPSRSSFSSSRPMGWHLPKQTKLRELPLDFFGWLKERETDHKLNRDAWEFKNKRMSSVHTDLKVDRDTGFEGLPIPNRIQRNNSQHGEKSPTPTPTRPVPLVDKIKINQSTDLQGLLPSLTEDNDKTPIKESERIKYPLGEDLPNSNSNHIIKSSKSIQELRESSKLISSPTFEIISNKIEHNRSESFELKLRMQGNINNIIGETYKSPFISSSIKSPTLSQFSEETSISNLSNNSSNELGGKKKWWKLGKKLSSLNLRGEEFDFDKRKFRDSSEDTISPGNGLNNLEMREEIRTPIKSPESGYDREKRGFWS
ncbi:uncharacterized protein I206_106191 [Kwoniella pini CBS 10737]|uniref:Dilute domain-containing protein n=1 Tax=Kwoniella pini CBS 10737 TaxID=1296096 RepID=A0A1B9I1E1_9TREE|nr:uncharacterized protein I206_05016 [Kwoniella pini CBS 10737]OCF49325.1 hypothetical protein I206_05016 [Kwoniella pini CBS 10737]